MPANQYAASGRVKIILEGLTGTGKSHVIAAMRRSGRLPDAVLGEEETFGDLMDEIDAGDPVPDLLRRLDLVRARLAREDRYLVERLHPSYYALLPEWSYYRELDASLASSGARLVVLTVPPALLRERCLLRREHGGSDWQGFLERYGSEDGALRALRVSQDRRLEAVALTSMPGLVVDTAAMDWDACAASLAAFAVGRAGVPRVALRDVVPEDLPLFYEHQADEEANRVAAVASRDRDAFDAHWQGRVLGDPLVAKRTIVCDEVAAGYVVSWTKDGKRVIGYRLGRSLWGRGIATSAVAEFVRDVEATRPLFAFVAVSNPASIRVLEKCGFEEEGEPAAGADGVVERLVVRRT
jgi:RimJ/RimL family protein N-acetyltransferase